MMLALINPAIGPPCSENPGGFARFEWPAVPVSHVEYADAAGL